MLGFFLNFFFNYLNTTKSTVDSSLFLFRQIQVILFCVQFGVFLFS